MNLDGGSSELTVQKNAGKMPALSVYALCAGEFGVDARRTPVRRRHPRTALPWRFVAHMLGVATFEVGNPIAGVVLMESNDLTLRTRYGRGFMQF